MTRTFRAPGRVNLIGEHTDYSGGFVLPAAIDRYVTIAGDAAASAVTLSSGAEPGTVVVHPDGRDLEDQAGWGRYVAGVAAELAVLGRPEVGFAGQVESDLPIGSGLSSSAALEVAVAIALCAVADFHADPLVLAQACQRAELRAVGVPSGIMDQAASLLGRAGHAVFLDCATLEHRLVPIPDELALLVVDSGVTRRLEASGYARRRSELERALAPLEGRRPTELTAAEAATLTEAAGTDPVASRRLRHVVTENARVREVVAALTRRDGVDRIELGRLFAAGHASLRDDYEVSTPELDILVALAQESGAVAARMTGGGFGGSIVALVEQGEATPIGDAVVAAYRARTGRRATAHVCQPADGATELT